MARAAACRDAAHGHRITFSPKVFVPLTMLCRDRCGYCTFAKPPARLDAPYLDARRGARASRARGAALGCHEALFTLGEAPEARYPQAAEWLAAHGYASTVDYLVARRAAGARRDRPAPPRQRRRARPRTSSRACGAVSPSQGMMIETLAARLGEPGGPHHGAPDKTPERRLATLEAAGRARVPFTTGILVGIGETRAERIDALVAIARRARAPRPRAGSDRPELPAQAGHRDARDAEPCPPDEFLWSIAAARLVLAADDAPAGAAEPRATTSRRCSRPASTTGAASRRSRSTT